MNGKQETGKFPRSQIFRQGLLPISLIAFLRLGSSPTLPQVTAATGPKHFATHHTYTTQHCQGFLLDGLSPDIMGREEQAEEREVLDSIFPEEITGTAAYSACQS